MTPQLGNHPPILDLWPHISQVFWSQHFGHSPSPSFCTCAPQQSTKALRFGPTFSLKASQLLPTPAHQPLSIDPAFPREHQFRATPIPTPVLYPKSIDPVSWHTHEPGLFALYHPTSPSALAPRSSASDDQPPPIGLSPPCLRILASTNKPLLFCLASARRPGFLSPASQPQHLLANRSPQLGHSTSQPLPYNHSPHRQRKRPDPSPAVAATVRSPAAQAHLLANKAPSPRISATAPNPFASPAHRPRICSPALLRPLLCSQALLSGAASARKPCVVAPPQPQPCWHRISATVR